MFGFNVLVDFIFFLISHLTLCISDDRIDLVVVADATKKNFKFKKKNISVSIVNGKPYSFLSLL
jgi:hypothetical protein